MQKIFIITSLLLLFIIFLIFKKKSFLTLTDTGKQRIVVSLTTSPTRINYIEPVINSICNQTIKPDYIYLNLPRVFKRNNTTFSHILPSFITDNPLVYVNFCEDLGPATKIIPTIYKETHPETYILSIDDDIYYPNNILEIYLKTAKLYNNCIITGRSYIPNKNNNDIEWFKNITEYQKNNNNDFLDNNILNISKLVDTIEAFSGVLYKRKIFSKNLLNDFYKHIDIPCCRFGDDFYLSNFFKKYNIRIITLNIAVNFGELKHDFITPLPYGLKLDALHKGGDGMTGGNDNNYIKATHYLNSKNELYLTHLL